MTRREFVGGALAARGSLPVHQLILRGQNLTTSSILRSSLLEGGGKASLGELTIAPGPRAPGDAAGAAPG